MLFQISVVTWSDAQIFVLIVLDYNHQTEVDFSTFNIWGINVIQSFLNTP